MFKLRKGLLQVINSLEDENKELKQKNETLNHNNLILITNTQEQRAEIKDLQNNLEVLVTTISKMKSKSQEVLKLKELIK